MGDDVIGGKCTIKATEADQSTLAHGQLARHPHFDFPDWLRKIDFTDLHSSRWKGHCAQPDKEIL